MATINYHPGEDAVFIHVHDRPSVRTVEVHDNVMVDYDENDEIVGYDIQDAREKMDYISRLLTTIPGPLTFSIHDAPVEQVNELLHHSL